MSQLIYDVHAFSKGDAHSGNPAGVCLLDRPRSPEWMQSIAARMKHSETAFLERDGGSFKLRWFTPTVEVDLCGHATLAAAHVLWETGWLSPGSQAIFSTKSGLLKATPGANGTIELDFPREAPKETHPPLGLLDALGVANPRFVGSNRMDYLVEVESRGALRSLSPDHDALKLTPARGVIVTARGAGDPYDFYSRFFAPGAGVPEDPVTGSAHCSLGPYWGEKLGKVTMMAHQDSERGGELKVSLSGDRVLLRGRAKTIFYADIVSRWPAL